LSRAPVGSNLLPSGEARVSAHPTEHGGNNHGRDNPQQQLGILAGSLSELWMMIVFAPVVSFVAIKLLLLAKATSMQKRSREWVFTQDRDENGLPILATAKVRSARSMRLR
jgi:hypothetical protein